MTDANGQAAMQHAHVGVLVVHGIGEQRRFEHIDVQVREIVAALQARPQAQVSVDIKGAPAAPMRAEQDTWSAAPTVEVIVSDPQSGRRVSIDFHEVWWADVNEPYSFMKQFRFWGWGLSVWLYPEKLSSSLPTATSVRPPEAPGGRSRIKVAGVRARLFLVAFVAVVGAASIGLITFAAERVLNMRQPNLIRVFVNYVGGVKLYNQKRRLGIGFPSKRQDFLDTLDEPPRVSIRRRMFRTIMDMAERPYERWYILAHSLGSVVAFNGLMDTAYALPGFVEKKRWEELRRNDANAPFPLVGPANPAWRIPGGTTSPRRPVWVDRDDVAYRSRIFRKFHGILTFGSPLEKFATIWPARVPISREPAFRQGTVWLNVYDPIDPVSGRLNSFNGGPPSCCPEPRNIGYAAGWVLLLNHLKYLSGPNACGSLADGVAEWLITGNSDSIAANTGPRWFAHNSFRHHTRTTIAWLTWIVAVAILALLGGLVFPMAIELVIASARAICLQVGELLGPVPSETSTLSMTGS